MPAPPTHRSPYMLLVSVNRAIRLLGSSVAPTLMTASTSYSTLVGFGREVSMAWVDPAVRAGSTRLVAAVT